MNKINSLYNIIEQKSKEKGRPLKIICDFDECLFPFRPLAIYRFGRKNGLWLNTSFSEFFPSFWENTIVEAGSIDGKKDIEYVGNNQEEKTLIRKFMDIKKKRRKEDSDKIEEVDVENAPFLSIAEDLLTALKENLVGKLFVISATHTRNVGESKNSKLKIERFNKSFGKFPNCVIDISRIKRVNGVNSPHRWEILRDKYPDFDIFVDDNSLIIKQSNEKLPSDKNYVLPDYKGSQKVQGERIYHVKTTTSDLTYQDFDIAALEMKTKELEKVLATQEREREREREREQNQWKPWIWGTAVTIGAFMLGIIVTVRKLRVKKRRWLKEK